MEVGRKNRSTGNEESLRCVKASNASIKVLGSGQKNALTRIELKFIELLCNLSLSEHKKG